ncbi:hypothetical protein [Streptomyces halobius]|uniref:hypothetical protein n=1 Tax=Streptomyces halobius TaxID=2879846 RepID=UPI0029E814EE|nr:hypothetical protein [Streptomyces halobius]
MSPRPPRPSADGDSYTYDKTGNTTGRGDQKLTWDAEGNLTSSTMERLDNKEQWHIQKGWGALKNMSSILEKDRKARETGKGMDDLLNDQSGRRQG